MKIKYFMFLVILSGVFIFGGCAKDSSENDNLGKLNQACKDDNKCNNGLACKEGVCISEKEACRFVTCTGADGKSHGKCVVEDSKVVCECEEGYQRVKNTKCELKTDDSNCDNIICDGFDGKSHGECIVSFGEAKCRCDSGYKVNPNDKFKCIPIVPPTECSEDTCAGKAGSICVIDAGVAKCECKEGYKEDEYGDCYPDRDYFCKDVICDENKNMTGLCLVREEEDEEGNVNVITYCECEPGWYGEHCTQSYTPLDCSICENDPNATGDCMIDPEDEEQRISCVCKDGYLYDFDNGCIPEGAQKSNIKPVKILQGTLNHKCFKGGACLGGLVCNQRNICTKADKITKDTVLVTSDEIKTELLSYKDGKLEFIRNKRTSLFKTGQILAFQDMPEFKNGLIGEIKDIDFKKDRVIVYTKKISPFEILAQNTFTINDTNISFDPPVDPNASTTNKTVTKSLSFDKSYYRGVFNIKGNMTIKYAFDLTIDLRRNSTMTTYKLKRFNLTNKIDVTSDLTLNVKAVSFTNEKIKIKYQGSDLMSRQKIATFTVYFPYGVKTKGEVYMSVRALYSAYMQGILKTKIKTESNFKSIIKYENYRTSRINDYKTEKVYFDDNIYADGRAGITFKIIPEVEFSAYSSAITNDVKIGTEVLFSQLIISSKLNGVSKSCYEAEGIVSLNSYATLSMMKSRRSNGVNMTWNKYKTPKVKYFNWLNGNKKCGVFKCDEDSDCRINQATMANTCSGTCKSNEGGNDYEFVDIPGGDFVRGCIGIGTE